MGACAREVGETCFVFVRRGLARECWPRVVAVGCVGSLRFVRDGVGERDA